MTLESKCPHCQGTGYELNHKETGASIREARQGAGITTRQIARSLGVSKSYVSALECGDRRWTRALREKFVIAIAKTPLDTGER